MNGHDSRFGVLLWLSFLASLAGACSGGGDQTPTPDANSTEITADTPVATDMEAESTETVTSEESGFVVYQLADNRHLYRVKALQGAVPEDLSVALDELSPGADSWVNISPDGSWLLIGTQRFGCEGWACAVRLSADLSEWEVLTTASGETVHPPFSAISSDGALVVGVENDDIGVHAFALRRNQNDWGEPILLTADSPYPFHDLPALSANGSTVLLSCGPTPYAQEGSGICEVGTDATGFHTLVAPADGPGGTTDNAARSADYADDGSVVFEADWNGEQIWRWLPETGTTLIREDHFNDNTPCVLPGGRIASLWLGREDGQGFHELKVTQPDGSSWFMLVMDLDILDGGIGCSR